MHTSKQPHPGFSNFRNTDGTVFYGSPFRATMAGMYNSLPDGPTFNRFNLMPSSCAAMENLPVFPEPKMEWINDGKIVLEDVISHPGNMVPLIDETEFVSCVADLYQKSNPHCGQSYANNTVAQGHSSQINHDNNKDMASSSTAKPRFTCVQCQKKFPSLDELIDHINLELCENMFTCNTCNYQFKSLELLRNHLRAHFVSKQFLCDRCVRQFSSSQLLQNHIKRIHEAERHKCDECSKSYATKQTLRNHVKYAHNSDSLPFKCEICGKEFRMHEHLRVHTRTHTGSKPYKCQLCSTEFINTSNLKVHMGSIHSEMKPFKCPVCEKEFRQSGGLKVHLRTHTGERPYACDQCPKRFTTLGNMKLHSKCHHQNRKNIESGEESASGKAEGRGGGGRISDKPLSLVKPKQLVGFRADEQHQAQIDVENVSEPGRRRIRKSFKCNVCTKEFPQTGQLSVHARTHTGDRPFKCDRCDKRFTTTGNLKTHMRVHTGEKPYKCTQCTKQFTQSGELKIHMRTHTGEKPYKCLDCTFACTTRGNLQTHMKQIHVSKDSP